MHIWELKNKFAATPMEQIQSFRMAPREKGRLMFLSLTSLEGVYIPLKAPSQSAFYVNLYRAVIGPSG